MSDEVSSLQNYLVNSQVSQELCRTKIQDMILKTQEVLQSLNKENPCLDKVFQMLEESDYNKNRLNLVHHHLQVIATVIQRNKGKHENLNFVSHEECLDYYIAILFMNNILPYKIYPHPVNINYDDPLKMLPHYAFLKEDKKDRLKFEKTINRYDILYVEVLKTCLQLIGDENAEYLESRVICRSNFKSLNMNAKLEHEYVYHLNVHVFMFKDLELKRLVRTDIFAAEVLKVVVLGKAQGKTFVTTNNDVLSSQSSLKSSVLLGTVACEDVPFDLNSIKIAGNFSSYADYLKSDPAFYNPHTLKNEISSIGIDPYRFYSFHPLLDGMLSEMNRQKEKEKAIVKFDSQTALAKAYECLEKRDLISAITAFEKSLECCPENYRVYEARGKMYLGMKKKLKRGPFLESAAMDFEAAIHFNPNADESKQCLSDIFVYLSKRFVKRKIYDKARVLIQMALKLAPNNNKANFVLKKIEKGSVLAEVEEDLDLPALQLRKQLIEGQLKKEKTF